VLVSKLTGYFDMGDIVMSNSLVKYIRQQFPQARIVLFARADEIARYKESFYSKHSWIDDFQPCPALEEKSWWQWLRLWYRMRALAADLCITNIGSLPPGFVRLTGIPRRIGVAPENSRAARRLTHPVNIQPLPGLPLHWTDVATAYMKAIGGGDGATVQHMVPYLRYEREDLDPAGTRHGGPIVVMHIGGAMQWNRRWPRESYLEIGVRLVRQLAASIVLVCGNEERAEVAWLIERLAVLCPGARVADLVGCSLNRVLNIYARASLYVGNDSGPLHLAVAMGLPVVALFGPSDYRYVGPDRVDPRHQVVSRNFPCMGRVCPQGCKTQYDMNSPDYPACMKGIEVGCVWKAITRRIGRTVAAGAR